jgi:hypothetical protein
MPLPQGAGRTAGAGAFSPPRREVPAAHGAQSPLLTTDPTTRDASRVPPRNPQLPLPSPFGLAGTTGWTTSGSTGVILFALAAALGFLAFAQRAQALAPCPARPRSYPYLLRLERPD